MTRSFHLDWLLSGISSAPVTVQADTEEPAVQDELWYRPCPESVPDTRFAETRDEVAEAEDVVLGGLAVLGEQALSSWAAADHLFNQIDSDRGGTAVVAPGGDGPRSGPETPLTPPDADPLPV